MLPEWGDVIRRDRDEKEGRPAPLREGLDPISARIDRKLGAFGAAATTEVGSALSKMREKMASQSAARESVRSLPRAPGASVPEPPEVDIDAEVARVARQMDDSPPAPRTNKPGVVPGPRAAPLDARAAGTGAASRESRSKARTSPRKIRRAR